MAQSPAAAARLAACQPRADHPYRWHLDGQMPDLADRPTSARNPNAAVRPGRREWPCRLQGDAEAIMPARTVLAWCGRRDHLPALRGLRRAEGPALRRNVFLGLQVVPALQPLHIMPRPRPASLPGPRTWGSASRCAGPRGRYPPDAPGWGLTSREPRRPPARPRRRPWAQCPRAPAPGVPAAAGKPEFRGEPGCARVVSSAKRPGEILDRIAGASAQQSHGSLGRSAPKGLRAHPFRTVPAVPAFDSRLVAAIASVIA
jgi:hypothetical protein